MPVMFAKAIGDISIDNVSNNPTLDERGLAGSGGHLTERPVWVGEKPMANLGNPLSVNVNMPS
jgi:hypothetical protein